MGTKEQILLILFGAILGAILSFLATEISAWRERKHSRALKKEDKENEIIGDALKFLFKANDIINDLMADKALLEKVQTDFPEKRPYIEQQMFKRFHANITKDFFNELMFHSFQLKRLENKTIWQEFESLMGTSKELTKMLTELKSLKECEPLDIKYKGQKGDFVEKCIEITKFKK